MGRVKENLTRFVVVIGFGGTLAATASGCATGAEGSPTGAMTPAQAAQVADAQCVGIPAKEQELGILAYRDAIAGAQPLKVAEQVGKVKFTHDRGVSIALRAQPGMSAQWLARVASCHMALAAAGRGVSDASGNDPLLVPGASVRVEEGYTTFTIAVQVPNEAAASDAMSRVHALVTGPAGPVTAQISPR
jgi:hypothetical protein